MKWNWITREFVRKINKFLNDEYAWEIPYESYGPSRDGNFVEWLKNNNVNQHIGNAASRDCVVYILNKLPEYEYKISENRDFGEDKKYYVYNAHAASFTSFRIGNFANAQNDDHELKWFRKYVEDSIIDISNILDDERQRFADDVYTMANRIRNGRQSLVKCSTTTLNNSKYMTGNYCMINPEYCTNDSEYKQNFAIYNSREVDKTFDELNSSSIKAFRGFVRYNSSGKNETIEALYSLSNRLGGTTHKAIKLAGLILSFFVKGNCMSEEAEYRHLLLMTEKEIVPHIDINANVSHAINNYDEQKLNQEKNDWYKKCEGCLPDFSCEQY